MVQQRLVRAQFQLSLRNLQTYFPSTVRFIQTACY